MSEPDHHAEKLEKLIRMANQIADFFRPYPDEDAIAGVQTHIKSFWTPSMRKELSEYAVSDGRKLHPQVLEAVRRAASGEAPTSKVTAGPEEVGQLASDAG